MLKNKVFLGGTCNGSKWRNELIPMLKIDYFNPVVNNWTPECIAKEYDEKLNICKYQLYVITPLMKGVFSIAEAVDASIKIGKDCIFCILNTDKTDTVFNIQWGEEQYKSLLQTQDLIKGNGATICKSLKEVADFLNNQK